MFTSICDLGIEHLYLCTMQIVDSHMHALRSTEWHQCTEKPFGILLKERNSIASHAVSSLWALAIHKVEALVFGDYDCQSFIPPSQHKICSKNLDHFPKNKQINNQLELPSTQKKTMMYVPDSQAACCTISSKHLVKSHFQDHQAMGIPGHRWQLQKHGNCNEAQLWHSLS